MNIYVVNGNIKIFKVKYKTLVAKCNLKSRKKSTSKHLWVKENWDAVYYVLNI